MDTASLLRQIPKVDRLLDAEELEALLDAYPRAQVVREVRGLLDDLRQKARQGDLDAAALATPALAQRLGERLAQRFRPFYRRVLNATGVILHTGLGRAPLPQEAVDALTELAAYPQRVEVDLESGRRGGRDSGCADLLCELTGAEAATVVNNNAAATLLILAALSRGKEVVLSRGELVEIGGSYRIPDVLRESGGRLVEVGTTNRTHEHDYRDAITSETGMILKVHPSNYLVTGFTSEVGIEALVAIGREHGVCVVHDLGSGCLVDLTAYGGQGEHVVGDSVRAGADLVCFSGDKLLGGPQAGLIVGKREAVERCRRHPLFRTLRPGRLIYTALEATLRLYLYDDAALRIPALARLVVGNDELRRRAEDLHRRLEELRGLAVSAVRCRSQAGSGSMPGRDIDSWAVRLVPADRSLDELAAELRRGEPPILARIHDEALLLDVRTLEDDALELVAGRLRELYPSEIG
jgi:L-seryl-tRNA(Ser) seleniumtransferase